MDNITPFSVVALCPVLRSAIMTDSTFRFLSRQARLGDCLRNPARSLSEKRS